MKKLTDFINKLTDQKLDNEAIKKIKGGGHGNGTGAEGNGYGYGGGCPPPFGT